MKLEKLHRCQVVFVFPIVSFQEYKISEFWGKGVWVALLAGKEGGQLGRERGRDVCIGRLANVKEEKES